MSRDAQRAAAATEVDRWEKQLTDELTRLFDRQEAVVIARLTGTKARKHTRHWEPPGERKIDPMYVLDPSRWLLDAVSAVAPGMRRLYAQVYDRVHSRLAPDGQKPPPPAAQPAPADDDEGAAVSRAAAVAVAQAAARSLRDAAREAGQRLLPGGRKPDEPALPSELELAISQRLDLIAAGISTAADEVQTYVQREEDAGTPLGDIVDGVRDLYQSRAPAWAQRIAVVNVTGAVNQAGLLAARDAGSREKQWLSERDFNVRPTHEWVDGDVVPLMSPFRLGGIPEQPRVSDLMFPGDPTAPLDEIIGCRCTLLFSPPPGRGQPKRPNSDFAGQEPVDAAKDAELDLEVKDKVRTPEGSAQYGLPIGATIPPGGKRRAPAVQFSAATRPGAPSTASAPAARQSPRKFPRVAGLDVSLAGRQQDARDLIAKNSPAGPPDPALTRVLAARDSKGRVGAYVVWQSEQGGTVPKGTVHQVWVHPSLRGQKVGDQMVAMVAVIDPDAKTSARAPLSQQPQVSAPPPVPAKKPKPAVQLDPNGLPIVASRARPSDRAGTSGDFQADAERIDRLQRAYVKDGLSTERLFSRGGRWTREREKQQQQIIDHFLSEPGVKADRKVLVIGGLPGAGKTTSINSADGQRDVGVNLEEFVTVNADEVKAQMIARGMVPEYPGLTADESATLFHAESFEVAHSLMRQAARKGLNFAYDTSLKSSGQLGFTQQAARSNTPPKWHTTLLFVDVPPAVAKQRARDRYLAGGRYMPLALIDGMRSTTRKHASGPAAVFDSIKAQADRWVLMDNTGSDPVAVASGGKRA